MFVITLSMDSMSLPPMVGRAGAGMNLAVKRLWSSSVDKASLALFRRVTPRIATVSNSATSCRMDPLPMVSHHPVPVRMQDMSQRNQVLGQPPAHYRPFLLGHRPTDRLVAFQPDTAIPIVSGIFTSLVS